MGCANFSFIHIGLIRIKIRAEIKSPPPKIVSTQQKPTSSQQYPEILRSRYETSLILR